MSRTIGELWLLSVQCKPNLVDSPYLAHFGLLGFSSIVYGAIGDEVGGAFFLASLTLEHASEFNSCG